MGKKCVVIGSGPAGISAAIFMARGGYEVTLLEQNHAVGGGMQCFTRNGITFETGMHVVGSASRGQLLDRLFDTLGVERTFELSQLDTSGYEVVSLGNEGTFRLANGRDHFVETLAKDFPSQTDALARYHDLITAIADDSMIDAPGRSNMFANIDSRYHTLSINSVLDEIFDDDLLKRVLVGYLPLYAGQHDRTPFALHAFITDFYNRSSYRVVGGSSKLSDALIAAAGRAGVNVETRAKVTRIVCDTTGVTGVEVNGERFVASDCVIAAIHPSRVIELTDSHLLRPAYRNRILTMPQTYGCFTVYMRFKPDRVPYMNHNFYSYPAGDPWQSHIAGGYMYMHTSHTMSPRFAQSGTLLTYMPYEDVAEWYGTRSGQRGAAYENFKKRSAERLLSLLENDFPGIRSDIDRFYTSSPLTWRDYTGTDRGAMYGLAKDVTLGVSGRVHYRTRIPNLILTGQNTNSHGILGTLVSSIVVCSDLLSKNVLEQ